MKIWLTLASIISVVSLPAQAYGGASSYPEVTCKLITPKVAWPWAVDKDAKRTATRGFQS